VLSAFGQEMAPKKSRKKSAAIGKKTAKTPSALPLAWA